MSEANTQDDFEFEIEAEAGAEAPEIEIEDDTPEEDRGREPLPKEIVDELEKDELDDYSEKVKVRLKQMKKVWHDERREKEREAREKAEALSLAQRAIEENKRLKASMSKDKETIASSFKQQAELEVAAARREYREAYESGDTDKVLEAQEKLSKAIIKSERIADYQPALQDGEDAVSNVQEEPTAPRPDAKTVAWQERNTWFGTDEEMTASALGLHQKLLKQYGVHYVGTDEYWRSIDTTMKRRFPEYFGENTEQAEKKPASRGSKPPTVVAPASRSTSAKKIVLKQSQLAIAKKLGLTPEQYAREYAKTER